MLQDKMELLRSWIEESDNIVFFGGQAFPRKAESRILGVRTGFTI